MSQSSKKYGAMPVKNSLGSSKKYGVCKEWFKSHYVRYLELQHHR